MSRRALYVSAFLPDPHASHAGGQVASQNLAALRRQGYDVTVAVCTTEPEADGDPGADVRVHQTARALLGAWMRQWLDGPRTDVMSWPILNTRANRLFERHLVEALETPCDLVFADFTPALFPLWRVLRERTARPRVVLCVHDVFTQKLEREPRLRRLLWRAAVKRAERRFYRWVDEVITLSEKDRRLVDELCGAPKAAVKPFEAPSWVAEVRRRDSDIVAGRILFFANFSRPENREAIEWFVREALPQIAQRAPHAHLVLAGGGSDRVRLPASACPVSRLGYQRNPAPVFSSCQLLVAPLARGAGVKFKVLEALASGVPVVGTAVAFEGIARSELTHEVSRKAFCEPVLRLLKAA